MAYNPDGRLILSADFDYVCPDLGQYHQPANSDMGPIPERGLEVLRSAPTADAWPRPAGRSAIRTRS